jgi:hypothetical protein
MLPSPPVTASPAGPRPGGPRKKGPAPRIAVASIVPMSSGTVRIGSTGADPGSFEWRGPASRQTAKMKLGR